MKISTIKEELLKLNDVELDAKADAFRQELFGVRINAATSHMKDYSQFKKLRKNIARALTYARNKRAQ